MVVKAQEAAVKAPLVVAHVGVVEKVCRGSRGLLLLLVVQGRSPRCGLCVAPGRKR